MPLCLSTDQGTRCCNKIRAVRGGVYTKRAPAKQQPIGNPIECLRLRTIDERRAIEVSSGVADLRGDLRLRARKFPVSTGATHSEMLFFTKIIPLTFIRRGVNLSAVGFSHAAT